MVTADSSDTRIRDRIAAISDEKERAAVKVEEVAAVLTDIKEESEVTRGKLTIRFQREPRSIVDKAGRIIGIDVMVRVYVDGKELQIDPHRVTLNPPMLVPDGTFRDETDDRGNKVQRPNFREDPREAFLQMLDQSIHDMPNPAGWMK